MHKMEPIALPNPILLYHFYDYDDILSELYCFGADL